MKTLTEEVIEKPELLQRVLEIAVDACWGAIESSSVAELDGQMEWMNLSDDFDKCIEEISLLTELSLLGVHPEHPTWVCEIAEL